MEAVSLMEFLGLESENFPVNYGFDFLGLERSKVQPVLHDFSNEEIVYLEDQELSFDFKKLERLLQKTGELSRSDRVIVNGDISTTSDDGNFKSASYVSEQYFFQVGDLKQIRKTCSQSREKLYPDHFLTAVFFDPSLGTSFVADIGS